MAMIETLPKGFLVRPPTMHDLQAVFELIHACDIADDGVSDHTLEDMRSYWKEPGFNMQTDAWMVVHPDGRLIGYADMEDIKHVRIYSFLRVLPKYRGQGIEQYLLKCIEERAQSHIPQADPEARITLGSWMSHNDKATAQLLEHEGFMYVRSFWRMEIKLEAEPQVPLWPDGVTVRTLDHDKSVPTDEQREVYRIFEMMEEAFSDHWGHMPSTFEEWSYWKFQPETFDPTLWFLAFDGNELAGAALCRYNKEWELGRVGQLAVRRPWRRKGLGRTLLLHSFSEFYRRNIRAVGLGVDSQNLTGATRLYTGAGMHIVLQHDTYEKELRSGKELSIQVLSS